MVTAEVFQVWPELGRVQTKEIDLTKCPELELARKASRGDMRAFEEVYRRHQRRVYSLCLRMTQNGAEAEDITQEVFVHLFRTIGSFRGESAFTTWLHRLTTNEVLMHFRKVKSRREVFDDDETTTVGAAQSVEAARRMPMIDRLALDRALAKLPPGYRLVFILHDVEGYEHEEIGRMLGIATGTSKSQLHKARMKLRKLLRASADKAHQ